MLAESLWDRSASEARRRVTSCLSAGYRGEKIFASMGSLAHYMQELSREGFTVADFVHEGNGVIWQSRCRRVRAFTRAGCWWRNSLKAATALLQRIRQDATFAQGMTRICDGGVVPQAANVTLYRRSKFTKPSLTFAFLTFDLQ